MTSITKKLSVVLFALIAAVCLVTGVLLCAPATANADAPAAPVTIDATKTGYLNISEDGTFLGLKDDGANTLAALLGNKYYALVLPESVTKIGEGTSATHILGNYANRLVGVTLPANLTEIGKYAFNGCISLGSVNIPAAVTSIGNYAFNNCTSLGSITYQSSDKGLSIGESAFSGCSALATINVPARVTSIGSNAYKNCSSANQVNYLAKSASYSLTASPFLGIGKAAVTIGNDTNEINQIPANLFRGTDIVSVTFNNFKTNAAGAFGQHAFNGCKNLTSVTFDEQCNIARINNDAFNGCIAISQLTLPDGLSSIGAQAFSGCSSLLELTVPASVTTVEDNAFSGCSMLLEVVYSGSASLGISSNKIVATDEDSKFFDVTGGFRFYDSGTDFSLVKYNGTATVPVLPSAQSVLHNTTSYAYYKVYQKAFAGNTSITAVNIPADVLEIGEQAFYGCTSLETVTFAELNKSSGLSIIKANTFQNCTSLTSVSLPGTITDIKAYAFDGCTSLANITFNKVIKGTGEEEYKLKAIESYAFRNTAISEISLPNTLGTIGTDVFANCGNLAIVYLPEALNSVNNKVFGNNAEGLTLIAPGYSAYTGYATNNHPAFNGIKLTYLTQIKLNYGAESENIGWRADDENLPVWAGSENTPAYENSVWYTESATTNKVEDTAALLSLISTSTGTLQLYSKTLNKPEASEFTANILTYRENAWDLSTDVELILSHKPVMTNYKLEISSYVNPFGVVGAADELKNAGTYTLSVNIADEDSYGRWKEGVPVQLTVSRATIQNLSALEWGVAGGNLEPVIPDGVGADDENGYYKTFYVYQNVPYEEKPDVPDNAIEVVKVIKSYVNYTGQEITVTLMGGNDKLAVQGGYTGNKHLIPGQYSAVVNVKVTDDNYKLPVGTDRESLAGQGISIDDMGNNVYSVTKTWYIFSTSYNTLIVSKETGTRYSIAGWQYSKDGYSETIAAPILAHGDINELVVFTLYMYPVSGEIDTPLETITFEPSEFASVINGVMPAGYYKLVADIAEYEEENIPATEHTVTFTVSEASISDLGEKVTIAVTSVEADYTGEVKFYNSLDQISGVFSFTSAQLHPVRPASTIWSDDVKYGKYYTGFGITVLVAGDRGGYKTPEEYTNGPKDIGKYTIYYNVYAPSYDSSFNDSDLDRSYILYLMGTVKPEGFEQFSPDFTGSKIYVPTSKLYEVIYLDDSTTRAKNIRTELNIGEVDNYTNAGTHTVVLMLNDRSTAKWDQSVIGRGLTIKADGTYGEYGIYTFTVNRANNTAKSIPTVSRPWAWKNYNSEVNAIRWSTEFADTTYSYQLISKTDESKVYYSNPVGDQLGFNDADAGEYWIMPKAAGNTNVRDFVQNDREGWGEVVIAPAAISWLPEEAPHISSFKYGDDNLFTAPTGKFEEAYASLQNEVTTYICLYSEYEKMLAGETFTKYENIKALQNANGGKAPAGEYVYVFELIDGENGNYEFRDPVAFTVLKAANYWDIAPVIQGWNYGDYNGLKPNCVAHFGDASRGVYEYRYIYSNGTGGVWTTINRLEENGQLPVGKYEYRVKIDGGDNYEELVFDSEFEVSLAQNSWVDIPNIIGWSEGRYTASDNAPVAKARFGNVYYTIKDAEGNVIISRMAASELNEEKLRSLEVGNYTLIAEVDGSENYGAMSDEAHFAVFEDSVGMTGLIAATMVFAVIAVGLAVAGVVLLIRRNRKIEQEFRRMVRSELRRK